MGKGIDEKEIVLRANYLPFLECINDDGTSTFNRMEGFTDFGESKNPEEHDSAYVDEITKRTNIISYSSSFGYTFEEYEKHPVHEEIIKIEENEVVGKGAVRRVIVVNMNTVTGSGSGKLKAMARIRPYTIIPDSSAANQGVMTHSGNFKSNGEKEDIFVTANASDDLQTQINELNADSGWIQITTNSNGGEAWYRKCGKTVEFRCGVVLLDSNVTEWNICTLPVGYRPSTMIVTGVATVTQNGNLYRMQISTDGVVRILSSNETGLPYQQTYQIHACFLVD